MNTYRTFVDRIGQVKYKATRRPNFRKYATVNIFCWKKLGWSVEAKMGRDLESLHQGRFKKKKQEQLVEQKVGWRGNIPNQS